MNEQNKSQSPPTQTKLSLSEGVQAVTPQDTPIKHLSLDATLQGRSQITGKQLFPQYNERSNEVDCQEIQAASLQRIAQICNNDPAIQDFLRLLTSSSDKSTQSNKETNKALINCQLIHSQQISSHKSQPQKQTDGYSYLRQMIHQLRENIIKSNAVTDRLQYNASLRSSREVMRRRRRNLK